MRTKVYTKSEELVSIYALIDPRDNQIRYIGKTKRKLISRLYAHLNKPKHEQSLRYRWISALVDVGLRPEIRLIERVPKKYWRKYEKYWIKFYRDLGLNLVNSTSGGEGCFEHDEKTKIKLANSSRGKQHSDETKLKLSKIKLGVPFVGKAKRNLVKSNKERVWSETSRSKIGDANKNRVWTEEARHNARNATQGKKRSDETKQRMSEAQLIRRQRERGLIV